MFRHHQHGKNKKAGKTLQEKLDDDNTRFYINLYQYFSERAQRIKNIDWDFTHEMTPQRGCMSFLCCTAGGQGASSVLVHARLTKPLYFTDESICLKLEVDNSRSERHIESIDVTLR